MKKSILIALLTFMAITACKKSSSSDLTNSISSQIVGTWKGTKNVTTYTDVSGKAQVIDNKYIYTYNIFSNGTASKTVSDGNGGVLQVYIRAVPYTITSANGKNYINFAVSPDDTSDKYQIISLTDHSLVLNINYGTQTGNVIPGTYAIGTNGVLDEEYTK
jgi:hypothetical protein